MLLLKGKRIINALEIGLVDIQFYPGRENVFQGEMEVAKMLCASSNVSAFLSSKKRKTLDKDVFFVRSLFFTFRNTSEERILLTFPRPPQLREDTKSRIIQ